MLWKTKRLQAEAWILDRILGLNVGTIHRGTPLPDFPIFALLHAFFGNFFFKTGIYNLDLT
jgi:hypothetical protein